MMLIHNICIAFSGLGSFRNVDMVMSEIAAILLNNSKDNKVDGVHNQNLYYEGQWNSSYFIFSLHVVI